MSKNSIRAIDLYCSVANWDDSLENAFPEEFPDWKKRRDRKLLAFKRAMQQVTREEFLRGRWGATPMLERIRQWDQMVQRAAS